MLNDGFLEEWVPRIISPEYGPNSRLEENKPLLSVSLFPNKKMREIKNRFYPNIDDSIILKGHILNAGRFLDASGIDGYSDLNDRYLIRINSEQSAESAAFCLAHETAHLIGFVENIQEHQENPDEWADDWAVKRCKEVINDPLLAIKIILEGLSNDFKPR